MQSKGRNELGGVVQGGGGGGLPCSFMGNTQPIGDQGKCVNYTGDP